MTLLEAREGEVYTVSSVNTEDEELNSFLFSLGCYAGEPITVISKRRGSLTLSLKDGRYSVDSALAEAIKIEKK